MMTLAGQNMLQRIKLQVVCNGLIIFLFNYYVINFNFLKHVECVSCSQIPSKKTLQFEDQETVTNIKFILQFLRI